MDKHLLVHQKAMAEDYRQSGAAVVGKVNLLLVDRGEGHAQQSSLLFCDMEDLWRI
jgi:hypothetical protein